MFKESLGLERHAVSLKPHDKRWALLFEEECTQLKAVLGDDVVDVQHIGSTSIPGMTAKPMLDIGVAVKDFEKAFALVTPIESLGYTYRGDYGVQRRHSFIKGTAKVRTHHIHMVEIHSENWETTLFFRNYLRQHSEAAAAYAQLKKKLAAAHPNNREAYKRGKHTFIQDILSRA